MPTATPPAPTFEDVWRTIQELAQMHKEIVIEAERRQQEAERRQQEAERRQQETERRQQEAERRQQETDRQIQELIQTHREIVREAERRQQEAERRRQEAEQEAERRRQEAEQEAERRRQEAERRRQEADRRRDDVDRQLKILAKQLGEHSNRLGEFVQEMVRPAVVHLFQERNLPVHRVMPNIVAYDDNRQFIMEIDLFVVNADTAIAVECKSHLSQADVDEHLERLGKFKQCFREYQSYVLLGAVAAMVLPDEVGRYAYRKGLFVLAQSGDAIEIRNDARFKPKTW